jgi:alpha-D-ribose 1-methylphosphonate 5-triphosphate synthase subunit PhnH
MHRETAYDPVHDSQRHFRILLDTMARPGKIGTLNGVSLDPPEGIHTASVLVAFALLNVDVGFSAAGRANAVSEYLTVNTASQTVAPEEADFLFLAGTGGRRAAEPARVGSLRYPDTGATLVVDVASIRERPEPDHARLSLSGPGVDGETTVYVSGLDPDLVEAIAEKNEEFPLGVDTILADPDDRVVCLPRTTVVALART